MLPSDSKQREVAGACRLGACNSDRGRRETHDTEYRRRPATAEAGQHARVAPEINDTGGVPGFGVAVRVVLGHARPVTRRSAGLRFGIHRCQLGFPLPPDNSMPSGSKKSGGPCGPPELSIQPIRRRGLY